MQQIWPGTLPLCFWDAPRYYRPALRKQIWWIPLIHSPGTSLNMTACRNTYISMSQQINTKYGSYLHVCSSSNSNNIKIPASFTVTSMASYSDFSTHAATQNGYLLLGIIPYFCPLLQLFVQWCSGSCFLCCCQLSGWKILRYKSKSHAWRQQKLKFYWFCDRLKHSTHKTKEFLWEQ